MLIVSESWPQLVKEDQPLFAAGFETGNNLVYRSDFTKSSKDPTQTCLYRPLIAILFVHQAGIGPSIDTADTQ